MKIWYTHIRRAVGKRSGEWWYPKTLQELIDEALETQQIKRYESQRGTHCRSAVLHYPEAVTICEIVMDDGEVVHGYSFCSHRDNFCRATGRKIAKGRAVAQLKKKNKIALSPVG